jgi:hypothetical protein
VTVVDGDPQYVTVLVPGFSKTLVRFHTTDARIKSVFSSSLFKESVIFPDKEKQK